MRTVLRNLVIVLGLIILFFIMTLLGVPGFIMQLLGTLAGKIPIIGGAIEAVTNFDKITLSSSFGDSLKTVTAVMINNLIRNLFDAFILGIISTIFEELINSFFRNIADRYDLTFSIITTAFSLGILYFFDSFGTGWYTYLSSLTGIGILLLGIGILLRRKPDINHIGHILTRIILDGMKTFFGVFFFTYYFMLPPVIRTTVETHGSIIPPLLFILAAFVAWAFVVMISAVYNEFERDGLGLEYHWRR